MPVFLRRSVFDLMRTIFCPRCAAENELGQAYCRQCGLALADVALALHGAPRESVAKLKSGSHVMNGGIAVLTSFMLIAVIITLLSITQGHPVLAVIAMLNAVLGAMVGLPLVIVGKMRVTQASRLLSGEESTYELAAQRDNQYLRAGVGPEIGRLPPGSVTDRTTLDLKRHRKP